MSIALSVEVKPSNFLLALVGLLCFGLLCIAALLIQASQLSVYTRTFLFVFLFLSAVSAFSYVLLNRKTFRIDICGIGQIRLKEDSGIGAFMRQRGKIGKGNSEDLVHLMSDSTVWPNLLLLRLKHANQRIRTLVILPDSTDRQSFRSLVIACRWIAANNIRAEPLMPDKE